VAKKVKKTTKKPAPQKTTAAKSTKKTVKKSVSKKTAKKPTNVSTPKTSKKKTAKTVRKSNASKTAASGSKRKTRKRPKSILSKTELQHFRDLLIVKLKEITGDVDHFEAESLKKSRLDASGDLSSMPIHMADIGSDNYEQEFALGLMDSERKLVHEILAALKRIDDGSYGICEGTGEPIPKPRLEGIPWTRYCVQYAELLEKGMVDEEDRWYDYDYEDEDEDEKDQELEPDEAAEEEEDEEDEIIFYGYHDEDEEEDLV
jgi:RNA polymerase-binding protein DksA